MFYRIFGKNGCGKTEYIFERLAECVRDEKRAFLVVPEQSAVDVEKQVITRLGGKSNLYIEVINFRRLCNRVSRQLGELVSVHLDDGAKKLVMLETLSSVSPFLTEYSSGVESAEFASKAISMINELRSCRVSAKKLEEVSEKLRNQKVSDTVCSKLSDIAIIAEAYDASLSEIPGVVSDIYAKLSKQLSEENFFDGCDVFFDSFYGFTAGEYEILSLIGEQADNVYVTFACGKNCEDDVFTRSIKAAKKCEKIAKICGCELVDVELCENHRHKKDSSLYDFAKQFSVNCLSGTKNIDKKDDCVKIVKCKDIYDEAKCAVNTVLSLARQGVGLSDIAILARNPADYEGVLDTAFAKAGIPVGMDVPETLSDSAVFELVISAFEAASTFRNTAVVRYVKSGLSGLAEQEADLFETYVKTWDISPSLMKHDEDWTMNPDGYVDSEPDEYILEIVNTARKKVVSCLESFGVSIKESKTVRDYALSVYNLLEDINRVCEREEFDDMNDGKSFALLFECLDSFCSCAGNKEITSSRFLTLLKSCGKDYNTGHIPSLCGQVQFSDVSLARCENKKYVIILGVNSGIFPSSCKQNSLFTDEEKQMLCTEGIELGEGAGELVYDELFLAYSAVTSAKEGCFITYLSRNVDSSVMFPSVIVSAVKRLTGAEEEIFDCGNFEKYFSGNEISFDEFATLGDGVKKNTLESYFSDNENYLPRINEIKCGFEQNDNLRQDVTDSLYGNTVVTSYSRLEKMAGCPFSHFCTYTLRLKPEPSASLGPSEAGSVMHKILEELVPLLCTEKDGKYPDEDMAKEMVVKLLCEHLSRIAHADVAKIPKRFVYLYNRLSKLLFEIAVNIVRELRVSKFIPSSFELDISHTSDVKPLPLDLGNGCTLYIIGQVDRVDVYENDGVSYVRIIDYKTGKKTFKLDDIRNGFNLQMLLYLAAITRDEGKKFGEKTVPAGVLYSNVVAKSESAVLGRDDISEMSNYVSSPVASGIFIDDEQILMAMDPTENSMYLPIGRKNGEITKKNAVTSLEEMGKLLDMANETAKQLAGQMMQGLKSVTPFDGEAAGIDIDPCRYCDMKQVCMIQD